MLFRIIISGHYSVHNVFFQRSLILYFSEQQILQLEYVSVSVEYQCLLIMVLVIFRAY